MSSPSTPSTPPVRRRRHRSRREQARVEQPILKLTSPTLCELCKSITVDFSKPKPKPHDPFQSINAVYASKFSPVRILATTSNETQDGHGSGVYAPSIFRIKSNAEENCPFCLFILDEIKKHVSVELSTNHALENSILELEFKVPAAYKRGSSSTPRSLAARFPGPYEITLRIIDLPVSGESQDSPLVHMETVFSGYIDLEPAVSLPDHHALSHRNIRLVKQWLDECDLHHESCKIGVSNFIPTRLLAVGTGESPTLRLVTPTAPVPYAALSYCWGDIDVRQEEFPTTTQNFTSRLSSLDFSELPKTIRDACIAARALDVQHIWVDALCILQDDEEDWAKESSTMSRVYSNAIATFAATSSTDVFSGLSLSREKHRHVHVQMESLGRPDTRSRLCIFTPAIGPILDLYGGEIGRGWNKRGWTLQERLLSRRVVHFQETLLCFECRESQHRESALYGKSPKMPWIQRYEPPSSVTDVSTFVTGPSGNPYDIWYSIISHEYCLRTLTFPRDKLPALSGLAEEIQNITNDDKYLAGLWEKDLPHGLLWVCRISKVTRCVEYRAPSWSWASVELDYYKIGWPWASRRNGRQSEIRILEASTSLSGLDPRGRVSGGRIVVCGKVIEASEIYDHELHDPVSDLYFMRDSTPGIWHDRSHGQAYLDEWDHQRVHENGTALKALLVMAGTFTREDTDLCMGLLLRRIGSTLDSALQERLGTTPSKFPSVDAPDPLDVFERVGCFHVLHRDTAECSLTFDVPQTTIVLV